MRFLSMVVATGFMQPTAAAPQGAPATPPPARPRRQQPEASPPSPPLGSLEAEAARVREQMVDLHIRLSVAQVRFNHETLVLHQRPCPPISHHFPNFSFTRSFTH